MLVAVPELLDPNFAQTIVLMIEHTDQGALGLVVNRPSEKSLAELWREVAEGECENDPTACSRRYLSPRAADGSRPLPRLPGTW